MPTQLNEAVILAALEGFEAQKNRLEQQISELRALLPGSRKDGAASVEAAPKKRHFSAAAISRMREAQKRRWAKVRGEEAAAAATAETTKPKKRRMSAAGRKAISEATKRRWALKRAEAAKATAKTGPARKKAAVRKGAKKAAAKKAAPAVTPATA